MHETTKVDPPRAGVTLSYKINTGNYENLNVSVSLSASAKQGETADALIERIYAKVEEKLVAKVTEAKAALA